MTTNPTLLLVEDEAHLCAGLRLNFELEGFAVNVARSARELGVQLSGGAHVDVIVLDVMLPDGNGFELCRALRDSGVHTPVIMLTARGEACDRVAGIDAGADDYLPKPFEMAELLVRVRALLRRRSWDEEGAAEGTHTLRFGNAEIDFAKHQVRVSGRPVQLTRLELDLLRYFARHQGRVLSREELLEQVWKLRNYPNTRSVDNFIVRLRKTFEPNPDAPRYFVLHRGVGYRFSPDGDSA